MSASSSPAIASPGAQPVPFELLVAAAIAAIVVPTLIAFNVSPSATFFNQAAAFIGWGAFGVATALLLPRTSWPRARGTYAVLGALGLLAVLAVVGALFRGTAWPLAWSAVGTLLAAMLVVAVAASAARAGFGDAVFFAAAVAFVVAGVLGSVVGLVQVLAPSWADGVFIAPASFPGRAVGNLRQPNHLSSLLLWSVASAVWLGEARPRWRLALWALVVLFVELIVLTASRTGLIGMFVLLAWGALDRSLPRRTRWFLAASPVLYFALWGGSTLLLGALDIGFEGAKRMSGSGLYVSNARYRVWENTLELIARNPLWGVGFGDFNFAWTLTPFPNRPVQFFDHAHNLFLHFAAELGVPLTVVVCGLLGWGLWVAALNALRAPSPPLSPAGGRGGATEAGATSLSCRRAAFAMVFMVAVHSFLEYPLWYSYFLLPACCLFGLCVERPTAIESGVAASAQRSSAARPMPMVLAGLVLVLGASYAVYDYLRVVVIFAPPARAASLEERIAQGQKSFFFGHHADYAAATTEGISAEPLAPFARATHFLLDTRLMMAWANALHESGQVDKAKYLAARLREFRNPDSADFFKFCDRAERYVADERASARAKEKGLPAPAPMAVPWQCEPPKQAYRYQDFR